MAGMGSPTSGAALAHAREGWSCPREGCAVLSSCNEPWSSAPAMLKDQLQTPLEIWEDGVEELHKVELVFTFFPSKYPCNIKSKNHIKGV